MALRPEAYEKAREQACFHVQVEVLAVGERVEGTTGVQLSGRIVRIFRALGQLAVGDLVEFSLPVLPLARSPRPPSGVLCNHYEDLQAARYMEVFLNGQPPACTVALYQATIIEGPTAEPMVRQKPVARKSRWQFWK